jgi:ring-1,2-phenylacetyl-CoA epoxidase subunit PaaE
MSLKNFHKLTVKNITSETQDCVSVSFDIPTDLIQSFKFEAGQYLTVRHSIGGEDIRRSYSICSRPSVDDLTIAIKKIKGGKFSTFANKILQVGDTLEVMPPAGNFIIDNARDSTFVFFAAGSGITPIIAQIKDCLYHFPMSRVTLLYGNKNVESVIFREELEALKNKFMDRFAIHYVFSQEKMGIPLLYGRINKEKCLLMSKTLFSPSDIDAFMVCGPYDMVFDIKSTLQGVGIAENRIHFELFNTLGSANTPTASETLSATESQNESEITVRVDGDMFEFSLMYSGQNLLDAAIANGADLLFSCKSGVCSTCKAKITAGIVDMDTNYALEPEEIQAGYVLLCQSHPRTPKVFIDFDQK